MEDRLLNELQNSLLEEGLDTVTISNLSSKFRSVISQYEITKKCVSIAVYEEFPDVAKFYLASRKIEGLAELTLNRYYSILRWFFHDVQIPYDQITTNHIRLWLNYKSESGTGNRTLDGYRVVINTFFNWCVDNDYLQVNPCSRINRIKYSDDNSNNYLTMEELERIRDCCETVRERVIVEMYYSTGMRCTEMTTVKVQDVDLTEKTVLVYNHKCDRYKRCYLSSKAIYWLKKYLPMRDQSNDYLIQKETCDHGKLTKSGIELIMRKIARRSGLDKHITLLTFRHTTATHALNNGMPLVDVQIMMDHKSPRTTLIYAKRNENEVKQYHQKTIM